MDYGHTVGTLPGALDAAGLIFSGYGGSAKPTRTRLAAVGVFAVWTEFGPTSPLLVHATTAAIDGGGGGGGGAVNDDIRVHVSSAASAVATMLGARLTSRRAPAADAFGELAGRTSNASPMYQVVWQCAGAATVSTNGQAATAMLRTISSRRAVVGWCRLKSMFRAPGCSALS